MATGKPSRTATVTEHEATQVERANASGRTLITFLASGRAASITGANYSSTAVSSGQPEVQGFLVHATGAAGILPGGSGPATGNQRY